MKCLSGDFGLVELTRAFLPEIYDSQYSFIFDFSFSVDVPVSVIFISRILDRRFFPLECQTFRVLVQTDGDSEACQTRKFICRYECPPVDPFFISANVFG